MELDARILLRNEPGEMHLIDSKWEKQRKISGKIIIMNLLKQNSLPALKRFKSSEHAQNDGDVVENHSLVKLPCTRI